MVKKYVGKVWITVISSFLVRPKGSRVLPVFMRYAFLALRTLIMIEMNEFDWNKCNVVGSVIVRKCCKTVVDMETLVGLSTGLQCSLKRVFFSFFITN